MLHQFHRRRTSARQLAHVEIRAGLSSTTVCSVLFDLMIHLMGRVDINDNVQASVFFSQGDSPVQIRRFTIRLFLINVHFTMTMSKNKFISSKIPSATSVVMMIPRRSGLFVCRQLHRLLKIENLLHAFPASLPRDQMPVSFLLLIMHDGYQLNAMVSASNGVRIFAFIHFLIAHDRESHRGINRSGDFRFHSAGCPCFNLHIKNPRIGTKSLHRWFNKSTV